MEDTTKRTLDNNLKLGNRMPAAHFYLGLAYQNMSQYKDTRNYILKAKKALFQAANLKPERAQFMWQFSLLLFEGDELYLCKQYAIKAWKQCKHIKRIANGYPKMKQQWNKQLKRIKCSYCGKHKY
eukprot:448496_1